MTSELKPCPFCGGQAERIEVREDDGFENRGGVAIECRQCRASSHVEFGRVENLVSSWNTRATPSADTLAGLVRYTYDTLPASMCLNNVGIAIYSEAAAEIEKLKEQNDKFKWQVRDTCTRAEAAEAELAPEGGRE